MARRVLLAGAAGLAAFAAAFVGAGARADDAVETSAYRVVAVKTPGVLEGVCRLEGAVAVPTFRVRKGCRQDARYEERPGEAVRFDPDRLTVTNCVIEIRGIREGKDWPEAMRGEDRVATLRLEDERFLPRVQWMRKGTQLGVINAETCASNLHGHDAHGHTVLNVGIARETILADVAELFLDRPGRIALTDDLRPWPYAVLHVMGHPYVAGPTALDGRYRIEGVPPGRWTIVCRHEGLREKAWLGDDGTFRGILRSPPVEITATVVVEPGGAVAHDFVLPVPAEPARRD